MTQKLLMNESFRVIFQNKSFINKIIFFKRIIRKRLIHFFGEIIRNRKSLNFFERRIIFQKNHSRTTDLLFESASQVLTSTWLNGNCRITF